MDEQDEPFETASGTNTEVNQEKKDHVSDEDIPKKREANSKKYHSIDSYKPAMRIVFHRINWSYVLAAAILLFLPIYNFAFTSRYGYPYEFKFFLDPELITNLDMERNLMELALPIPIYIFLGILPGLAGLVLGLYILLSGTPHVVYLDEENIRLYEMKVIIPKTADFHADGLQKAELGKKRTSGNAWFGLFCLLYLAGLIWYYGFDSVISSGTWYYFNITQPVWDGTTEAFRINLGVQLFVTVILLLIAGCLLISFPRREFNLETDEASVNFVYSFMTIKKMDHYDGVKKNQLMRSLEFFKTGTDERDDSELSESDIVEEPSIFENTGKTSKYTPRLKLTLLIIGIIALIAIQVIPGFFFGDFLIPFGVVGLIVLLKLLLRTLNFEWYTSQQILRYKEDITIIRKNPLAGKRLTSFIAPSSTELIKKPYYPSQFDYIMGGFLIWEICIVIFNMFEFIGYFITNAWTLLQLTLCILFIFIVVYYYFKPIQRLKVKPTAQPSSRLKKDWKTEFYTIEWPIQKESMASEFKSWKKDVSEKFSSDEWKRDYLKAFLYFAIPIALFIAWIVLYLMSTLKFFVYLFI